MNLRTDYHKLEHRKKAGLLTARQLWMLKHLSYLKPFYKQCYKSVQGSGAVGGAAITSTDDDQELEQDDRGHESRSSSRKETPTKIPVFSSELPLCKPKKRRETEKEEKSSSFNEIMEVVKELASHLVSRARTVNQRDRERESFFQCQNEFTSRMPQQNWHNFHMQSIQLAMQFMPADLPKQIHLDHTYHRVLLLHPTPQQPMDPQPRPAPTASGGYIEMLQPQPQYGWGS